MLQNTLADFQLNQQNLNEIVFERVSPQTKCLRFKKANYGIEIRISAPVAC